MDVRILIILVLALLLLVGLILLIRQKAGLSALRKKYADVINLGDYKDKLKTEISTIEGDSLKLRGEYQQKKQIYDALQKELSLYEEEIEISSYGLYKPHYEFNSSELYKARLEQIRDKEKLLIKNEQAFFCQTTWTVQNSRTEGKKMTKQYGKLMLRAFNGEIDALVSNVRWNNIMKSEERLAKAYEAINKLGVTHAILITKEYYNLKLEELRLAYEYEEKRRQEKEEQRRIQEQIREDEKVQREIEKAMKEAEDDEKRYNLALEQARAELSSAQGEKLKNLNSKIAALELQLKEALEKKERAISQAQLTKSGHIYIISNIGSFGEDVFKIGLTRRLEPLDRIRELGDASVPFEFDIHAMIHSENAPELEYNIQKRFEDRKINLLNNRKEFFKLRLEELEKVVHEYKADIEFTKIGEAREFHESKAMREQLLKKGAGEDIKKPEESIFPESI